MLKEPKVIGTIGRGAPEPALQTKQQIDQLIASALGDCAPRTQIVVVTETIHLEVGDIQSRLMNYTRLRCVEILRDNNTVLLCNIESAGRIAEITITRQVVHEYVTLIDSMPPINRQRLALHILAFGADVDARFLPDTQVAVLFDSLRRDLLSRMSLRPQLTKNSPQLIPQDAPELGQTGKADGQRIL